MKWCHANLNFTLLVPTLFGILWGLSPEQDVWAVSGFKVVLPASRPIQGGVANSPLVAFSKQSRLKIEVDAHRAGDVGYRPVQVTVTAPTAATAERQLTIRLEATHDFRSLNRPEIAVEQDFQLSVGSTTTQVTVLLPQFIPWNLVGWELWVDGQKDRQLSMKGINFGQAANNQTFSVWHLPDELAGDKNQRRDSIIQSSRIVGAMLESLPRNWTEYSNADVVIAYPRDLHALTIGYGQEKKALLRWVRSGGNLLVPVGDERYQDLDQIDEFLGAASDPPQVAWHAAPLSGAGTTGVDALLRLTDDLPQEKDVQQAGGVPISLDRGGDSYNSFVLRPYGMGTVTALRGAFDEECQAMVEQSMLAGRYYWRKRHGNDPAESNFDFNNFLNPDVGLAPVFEFQFLITLFVLGIGPLNYWLLKRSGRLPMLLATVPLAALLTTVVLFAYGYLSEGVTPRVRVRSFTQLDQRAGEAVSWSRLSYYAGVAPSGGLTFPADTVLYPILPASRSRRTIRRYASQEREVEWENGQGRLTEGWLPSRTPTQYLGITARSSDKQLVVSASSNGLEVKNRLGAELLTVAVRDEEGIYYLGGKCAPEDSIRLQKMEEAEVIKVLRDQFSKHELLFPPGGDMRSRRNETRFRMSQSLLETQLGAVGSPVVQALPRKMYVAVTKTGIETELGVQQASQEHSVHYVRGSW